MDNNLFRRPSAYVVPPTLGADRLFLDLNYPLVTEPEKADFIVLCGGEDINFILYNETPIKGTIYNPRRDQNELDIINEFKGIKPFVGICRGAQLLNVIAGGKLWQDVSKHSGVHSIWTPYSPTAEQKISQRIGAVNSVHHQMMRPGPTAVVLAVAWEADYLKADGEFSEFNRDGDPEIIVYPDMKFFCFQPHPEFGHAETTQIFVEYFNEFRKKVLPMRELIV